MNLTKGDYSTLPNYVYKQGFSFLGSPGLALDKILDRLGYQWTISNNTLIISKHNESYNQTIGQFLSNETGLLYAPERINEVFTKTKVKKNKLIDGWKIKSLILPSIQPKGLIRVDSSNVKGDFLVKSVIFNGDTEGQNWFCQIEAIKR